MRSWPVLSLVFLIVAAAGSVRAGADSLDRLRHLQKLPLAERQAELERESRWFRRGPAQQILGDTILYFHRGTAREVRLVGDETAWEPGPRFTPLPGTDLKYLLRVYAPGTRLDYKLLVDGAWSLDPFNPRTMLSGFGPNSEMAFAYQPPWWLDRFPQAAPCRLDTLAVPAPGLGGVRTVVVVVPPGAAASPRPFLLVHDGLEFLAIARLHECLARVDALVDDVVAPILVCVPPGRRTEEYAGELQETFARWLTETLRPEIATRYAAVGLTGEPWGAMGASYGGRIVLAAARLHPGAFDRLAPLSPSVTDAELDRVRRTSGVRVYAAWGAYDIPALIPGCEDLAAALAATGLPHACEVLPQGHSWGLWRDVAYPALRFLYGPVD